MDGVAVEGGADEVETGIGERRWGKGSGWRVVVVMGLGGKGRDGGNEFAFRLIGEEDEGDSYSRRWSTLRKKEGGREVWV